MSLSRLISNPAPKAFGHGALLATAGLAFGFAAAPPALSAEIIFDLTNDPPTPIPTNNFTFTQSGVELTINVLGSTLSGNSNPRGVCAYSSMPGCGDGGKATATPQRTLTGLDFSFTTPVELVSYEIERIRVAASDVGASLDYTPNWTNGSINQSFPTSVTFATANIDNTPPFVFTPGLTGTAFTNTTTVTQTSPLFEYRINSLVVRTIPAPAPLPIFGATLAYGWSRKLRQRIKKTA